MYQNRFFSQFNKPLIDLGREGRMAVRQKGFSCHLLGHIRSRGFIYGVSILPELHVYCPIPFFPFDLFPKLIFPCPPTFPPSCHPLPFSTAPDVFSCACCLHCQLHADCVSPDQFEGAVEGDAFQESAYCSCLGFCQGGFREFTLQLGGSFKV